jgi:hypothetical protein
MAAHLHTGPVVATTESTIPQREHSELLASHQLAWKPADDR